MASAALKEVPSLIAEPPPGCGLGSVATYPDRPELGAEWILLTASLARRWRDLNIVNRTLRPPRIRAIASDILGDAWIEDGSTIVFILADDRWQMMDGQHRIYSELLAADKDPEAAILTLVVWGVPGRAKRVKDTGAPRSVGDYLSMEHQVPNAKAVAAITNRWATWLDLSAKAAQTGGADERYLVAGARNTQSRQIDIFEDEGNTPLIGRAALFATWAWNRDKSMRKVSRSAWGIAWLILNQATGFDPAGNTAEFFLTTCVTGENIKEGDPAYSFRTRLQSVFADKKRITEQAVLYYLFSAWTAFRGGKRIGKLQLPRGPINSDNFPIPR